MKRYAERKKERKKKKKERKKERRKKERNAKSERLSIMAMETQTVIDRICKIQTKMHSQRKKKEREKNR